jgi:hypothetical protein
MKISFEFNIDKLVGRPKFGIYIFVELNDLLVILSFGDFRGLDKKRNPIVSSIAVKVSCMEVISIDEIFTALINEDNNVNLIITINIL